MEGKAKYTVITKIIGIFMVLLGITGIYFLNDIENMSLVLWHLMYILFIPVGGILNIFDFAKTTYCSKFACFSYAVALIFRVFFDIAIAQKMHWDFLLILAVALSLSILRFRSVSKAIQSKEASPIPVRTGFERKTYVVDNSKPECQVGIIRESRASGCASALTIYVDDIKTTTLNNGKMTKLSLSPGKHVIGFSTIGCKIKTIALELAPGSNANIMCRTTLSGIEAVLTSVDVCSLAGSQQPAQSTSGGSGCLVVIFVIILLFALGILSIKFTVFLVPIR